MNIQDIVGLGFSFLALVLSVISLRASSRAEQGRVKLEFEQKRQEALLNLTEVMLGHEARQRNISQLLVNLKINPSTESDRIIGMATEFQDGIPKQIQQVRDLQDELKEISGVPNHDALAQLEGVLGITKQWGATSKNWDAVVDQFIAAGQQLNDMV